MLRSLSCVLLISGVLAAPGCATPPRPAADEAAATRPLANVILVTGGVEIRAVDDDWAILTDAPLRTPFHGAQVLPVGKHSTADDAIEAARRAGAERVRVVAPGYTRPLYGLLYFAPVQQRDAWRAAAQDRAGSDPACAAAQHELPHTYTIRVGPAKLNEARDGGVAVAWQPYGFVNPGRWVPEYAGWFRLRWKQGAPTAFEAGAWILWMSDVPLLEEPWPE